MGKGGSISQERLDYVIGETDWLLDGGVSPELIASALKLRKVTIAGYASRVGRYDIAAKFENGWER